MTFPFLRLFIFVTLSLSALATDNVFYGLPSKDGVIINREGYTLAYDEKAKQASWVSYVLTKEEAAGEVKRSNSFKEDKDLAGHSAKLNDYKKSGYDRGHLAPAADMRWSKQVMKDSFFLSNMSPQKPGFNRGVWKRLEALVRKWGVLYKKIVIITGPILSQEPLTTIGESKVAVPVAYYKAIYAPEQNRTIAFIVPHEKSKKSLDKFSVSVDELEKLSELDFFSTLPDEQEEKLESEKSTTSWNWL